MPRKPAPTRRPTPAALRRAAARAGAVRARRILKEVPVRRPRRAGPSPGILLAEGDSWFDYPFYDVLKELEDRHGYEVEESVAHKGDTVEAMAYDNGQLAKLARAFRKVAARLREDGKEPKAILLSGGGNDIAGDEFAVLLNHQGSGLPVLQERIVEGVVEERLSAAMVSLINSVTVFSEGYFRKKIPVVLHGYAYPVPDGRGYLGGAWKLPGPWLQPGFRRKGYEDLWRNASVMEQLIDRFNGVLQGIAGSPGHRHVSYVDLRPVLANDRRTYKKSWGNELHPTRSGFRAVAQAFHSHLQSL